MDDDEEVKPTASPQSPPEDVKSELVEEKEAEDEIKDTVVADDTQALDGTHDLPDAPSASAPEAAIPEAIVQPEELEARIPAKKDATLREFLSKLDDYAPIVSNLQPATFGKHC